MYKRFEAGWLKHFDFLILDMLALQLAFILSSLLRFGLTNPYTPEFYVKISVLLLIINGCVAFFDESYRGIRKRGYLKEAKSCVKHAALVIGLLLLYLYLAKQNTEMSRLFFLYLVLFSLVFLWLLRSGQKLFLSRHEKKHPEKQYNLLVLAGRENIHAVLENLGQSGCRIVGVCLADDKDSREEIGGVPVVAEMDTLLDYIKGNVVDGLFVRLPEEISLPDEILETCAQMGVSTHIGLLRTNMESSGQIVERIGGYTVLTRSVRIATVRQLFIKRMMDICAGLAGVLVTGIAFLFVAPAIYMASPGPIFFSQTRVGKNGRKFKIYKFRSMYMDAEERKKELEQQNQMEGNLMFKLKDDPRIIKGIGNFIRKTSLDEFPQFWNVLKGDMSLVGTRPPTEDEWEQYQHHHRARMAIKPGITGMWQVSGRSDITDFEEVVRLDLEYIRKWNTLLDLKILFMTVFVVLLNRGAK